jgi:lipopolysaccharide export system protein LptC
MAAGPGLYSRVVAVLKVGLPLIALALLAGLFLSPREEAGEGVVFSPGDERFHFTADLVVPDAAPPERAAITRPAGTIELEGGPVVTVEAERGDLHLPSQRLDLVGDVRIETSDGYRLLTDKATLDLRTGAFVAGDAVEGTGPLGTITSQSLHVAPAAATGEARRFSFSGGVRLVYDPPDA